jgi:hypothetical protein
MRVMAIPLPSAPTAITVTILTPARPTGTMVRRGSTAASSSARAPGSVAATAAAFMDIAAASMDALSTDGLVSVMDARDSVAAIAEARLEVDSVVDSTAVRVSTVVAVDSMVVAVADSTVAAVADSTVAAAMVVADTGKASVLS